MLCDEGKLSIKCFLGTATLVLALTISQNVLGLTPHHIWGASLWGPVFYFVIICISLRLFLSDQNYQYAIRATFLGFTFSSSILVAILCPLKWKAFGVYGTMMSIFHYSEFLAIAWSNPSSLSTSSFILNHSLHYALAAISSWIEFLVEVNFWPEMKEYTIITVFGLLICLGGELLRKLAIITAHTNFNHIVSNFSTESPPPAEVCPFQFCETFQVQYKKSKDHVLVKHGVYSIARHPSYVGWFWWSIGTQIILANPVCVVIYAIASWKFFNNRVYLEEITLLNFFGEEYYNYQKEVPTGLPFINGYLLDNPITNQN
ncbi:Protein-S-isoprenylcysteine O-methyltransferase [Pseudolycoriella hygida]|uniref:Protein-S-isoprenylcysteine O-methyltransferase n=1 Tax=Pseudolycoriella hygida TaxID=35572 RepID=A0A9Q0RV28_9DIPT|nr:Protein-S-isoprenylcysteine O-methyltransferase [Pseudolycoriella hygida]